MQEWADLGIGSAILPRSKLQSGTYHALMIYAADDGPLLISYQSLWHPEVQATPEVGSLATFLRNVAPTVVRGLHQRAEV